MKTVIEGNAASPESNTPAGVDSLPRLVRWIWRPATKIWDLMDSTRNVATVWRKTHPEGVYWHTWDKAGTGGENDISCSVEAAMADAESACLRQGFISANALNKLIRGHFQAISPQIGTFSRPADRKAHTGR